MKHTSVTRFVEFISVLSFVGVAFIGLSGFYFSPALIADLIIAILVIGPLTGVAIGFFLSKHEHNTN